MDAGVDVITSGNHGWDSAEAEIVHRHSRVLRPYKLPDATVGKGTATLEVEGEPVSVLNLGSATAVMADALPVYQSWSAAESESTVIVEFRRLGVGEDGIRHRRGRQDGGDNMVQRSESRRTVRVRSSALSWPVRVPGSGSPRLPSLTAWQQ
jgi:hypothetical protein